MCELCRGRLMVLGEPEPCPNCLTCAATDDVREVAREWLGFDVWVACGHSERIDGVDWPRRGGSPRLPLYRPAGRDLAVRVLARRLGCPLPAIFYQPKGYDYWALRPEEPKERIYIAPRPFPSDGIMGGGPKDWVRLDALATIPEDAPADLRAARALVLCLEATGG